MAAIERTAYPYFKRNPVVRELVSAFTIKDEDLAFLLDNTRQPAHRLTLAILLKSFQRLGYFPNLEAVPVAVMRHVRSCLKLRAQIKPLVLSRMQLSRYCALVRSHLRVEPYDLRGTEIATRAVELACTAMDNPADLINVALEHLARERVELPAFSTLDRLVARIRAKVNKRYFADIEKGLSAAEKRQLDELLVATGSDKSPLQMIKRLPKRASLTHFQELIEHITVLETLIETEKHLNGMPEAKRKHFAAEARALDASELKDLTNQKRHAVLLCLIHRSRMQTRDDIAEMFIKRVGKIHNRSKEALEDLQIQNRQRTVELAATMADVVKVLHENPEDADAGREIRALVEEHGGADTLREDCDAITACYSDNHYPLLWPFYKSHRRTIFRMVELLDLTSTSEDRSLRTAIDIALALRESRSEWVDEPVDLAFATQQWRKTVIVKQGSGNERVHRQFFELCVFSSLANSLKSGDMAVGGSEMYADYRQQLLPWSECETQLKEFCEQVGLPDTAAKFVSELRARLTRFADLTDQGYLENKQLVIGEDGIPVLKPHRAQKPPRSAIELENEVLKRMPVRSVLEILCDARHWLNWTRHFGPVSGSDPKLENPTERYIATTFTYGCNLGPAQAARHFRGAVSEHQLSFVNRRHVDANKLSAACRDIINSYSGLQLPRLWGDGLSAAADGTKFDLYDQNLMASYHIRYGGWGGIAYHHVSNTYSALFSHFIPCGVWEAIFIIDGLLKNTSDIQPTTVHADTQGQSLPVFGLCYLLGISLMPRIRNWKEYRFYRPEPDSEYENIDKVFREKMDWDLIETHWKDLMQVAISIKAGKITASTLLRKLGNYSRQNRLYQTFKELGAAIRTMFLLQYVSDDQLRENISAETNKVEAYNGFSKYFFFGGEGTIANNDPIEQEKAIKYNDLVCNAIIFYNVVEQTRIIKRLIREGWKVTREDVALLSPYITTHIKRLGDYSIDLGPSPDPYDPDFPLVS